MKKGARFLPVPTLFAWYLGGRIAVDSTWASVTQLMDCRRRRWSREILTALSVPSQFYLGSALVDTKTNEIPVARELFGDLNLTGRTVALDALHTQDETARQLVMEQGAHYQLTVKNNQPTLRQNIDKMVPTPPRGFSPSGSNAYPGTHPGEE
jgi:glycerol kinase